MTSVTFPTESSATEVDGSVAHVLPSEYAATGARRHRGGHQPLTGGLVSPRPDSTVVERNSAGAMSSHADDAAAMLAGAVKHYGSGESAVVALDEVRTTVVNL
jgi:hypothetical protein